MKNILISLSLILSSFFVSAQGTKNFIDQPYIEVSGTAELEVTPNEIYLQLIIDEDDNSKVSVEKLEESMLQSLKSMGIDLKEQLKVKDQSSDFKKYMIKKDKIHTAKEFELLVYDAPSVANVFIELEKLGISNINIVKLDHSDMDQLKLDVKVSAIRAAKRKAQVFAQAIDQEIGNAIHISERQFQNYQTRNSNVMMSMMESQPGSASKLRNQIAFDKIQIAATVDAKFELN